MNTPLDPETLSFTIDKKFLFINFTELNLIQLALFALPKRHIAVQLKKLFNIPHLSAQEIMQELNTVHSPLRKYLTALLFASVRRCELLLSEQFQAMLQKLAKQKKKALRTERGSIKRNRRRHINLSGLRAELTRLDRLATQTLQRVPVASFSAVKTFLLEGHRYDLLHFYLAYADATLAPVIVHMVDSHITMLTQSYQAYERISQRSTLTAQQHTRLHAWLDRRINRIVALNPETIHTILPHLPLSDPVSLKQYIVTILTGDLMEFRELQQIEHAPTLESVPLETDLQEDTHEATQSASGSVSQKSVARQPTLQYVLVQNELNALLMDHLEKESGIFIHAASPLLAFLDLLTSVIQKKNVQPDVLAQLNATGSQVVYTLQQVEAVDYAPFITCIRKILGDKENSLEKAARAKDNVDPLLAHPTDRPVSAASPDLSPNNRVSIAPVFLPAIGLLIEMASSRTISEALRLALIDLACMLKSSPAVTHAFAVSVLEHYHQLKQQFPAVDTTGALLGELTKLSLLEASSRIDQPPADFEF